MSIFLLILMIFASESLLALASPELEIKAITINFGEFLRFWS